MNYTTVLRIIRAVIEHEISEWRVENKNSPFQHKSFTINYRPEIQFDCFETDRQEACDQWTIFHDPKWKPSTHLASEIEKKLKLAFSSTRDKIDCSVVPVYNDLHLLRVRFTRSMWR